MTLMKWVCFLVTVFNLFVGFAALVFGGKSDDD